MNRPPVGVVLPGHTVARCGAQGARAGIDRGRVGDVLVNGERGAHLLVAPDVVQFLEDNLTQARSLASPRPRWQKLSPACVRPGWRTSLHARSAASWQVAHATAACLLLAAQILCELAKTTCAGFAALRSLQTSTQLLLCRCAR